MVSAQGLVLAPGCGVSAAAGLGAATLASASFAPPAPTGALSQRSNIQCFSLSRSMRTLGLVAVNEATFKVCFVMSASASTSSKRPTLASAVLACVNARPSADRRRALNLRSGLAQAMSICPLSLPSSVGSRLCAR